MKKIRVIQIVAAIVVLALLSLAALVLFLTKDGAPLFSDFKGYTSKRTLNDSVLVETKFKRIQDEGRKGWRFEYDHLYDSGITMHQGKRTWGSDVLACHSRFTLQEGEFLKSCQSSKLNEGGQYIVAVITDQGQLSSIKVYAVIGETEFYTDIPSNLLPYFVNYLGWREYFNSMKPIDLRFKPYSLVSASTSAE